MRIASLIAMSSFALFLILAGCSSKPDKQGNQEHKAKVKVSEDPGDGDSADDIKAARAKLSPEDLKLVEAQEYCAVADDSRLGGMGVPIKIMVKDQPVFLCCKGCQRKALAEPDRTLARVEELKAKVKAEAGRK
ncbi:MAG: hypothetical protein K2X38_18525 [Gemmataceae bacterium]|nr:hypothetical protein [Gemmataceae bacterium]